MTVLKVGIIGAGGIATSVHIRSYLNSGFEVEIVGIADVALERAQEVAAEFDIPHVFSSYNELFDKIDLDAVSVCVPNKFHADASMSALKAGCHVLCEKPPAMNAEEAELMMKTAEEAGKILTYGFHFRYQPEVETA